MANTLRGILSFNEYRQPRNRAAYILFFIMAVLLSLVMVFPLIWVFLTSLKAPADVYKIPVTLLPETWNLGNFATAWRSFRFPLMLFNTFAVYLATLTARLLVVLLAAYSLSKLKVPFRRTIYLLFLSTLVLPVFSYIIPSFLVINAFGLYDNWLALILPGAASSFPLLLAKGFMDEMPIELCESARIDGSSELRILWSIILPIAKPVIAVISILAFLEVWNNFFWPQLVITSSEKWTMPIMLWYRTSVIGGNPPMNIQLAGMFFSILPPLILFMFFQRYITEGVTFAGIKG
ncbi:carbohydrate ABC transporter permease [Spirochaeta lutea]|uniref:carbohydrate ABC transporter permease n=1 Tax=Spirochaeta lutea TaxID=1480694 RepID=UPI0006904014|nr:carbohydrate ABC transporter permease [Spirochaeta lutea]